LAEKDTNDRELAEKHLIYKAEKISRRSIAFESPLKVFGDALLLMIDLPRVRT
jgi:hypothetical protein